MAPERVTFSTAASRAGRAISMSPEYISTSPASTTSRSTQAVGAQGQARPRAVVGEVVAHPDRHRPEPRARTARGAAVEGRPEDDDLRVGVRRWVVEVAHRDAQEGEVRSELLAVAAHVPESRHRPPESRGGTWRRQAECPDGPERPECVDQVGAVLRRRATTTASRRRCASPGSRRPSGRGCPGTPAPSPRGPGTNQNWLRYQPPGSTSSLSVCGEGLRVRRAAGATRRSSHDAGTTCCPPTAPSSSSSLAEARQVPRRRGDAPVVDAPADPSQVISASCSAPIGSRGARDQVGHPAPAGALAHPAEHVGVGGAVGEVAAVGTAPCRASSGTRTCRPGRPPSSGRQPIERSITRTSESGLEVGLAERDAGAHVEQVPDRRPVVPRRPRPRARTSETGASGSSSSRSVRMPGDAPDHRLGDRHQQVWGRDPSCRPT